MYIKTLELSNKITANKLAQVEAETRIAEAQTEQLGIQEKLKAIEEQRAKEQREQIMNRMKEGMMSVSKPNRSLETTVFREDGTRTR